MIICDFPFDMEYKVVLGTTTSEYSEYKVIMRDKEYEVSI